MQRSESECKPVPYQCQDQEVLREHSRGASSNILDKIQNRQHSLLGKVQDPQLEPVKKHFNIRIIIIILYTSPRAKFFIWYIVWRSFFDPRWAASSGTKKRVWNGVSRKHKEMVKWFDVRIKARTWRVALFHSNSRSNLRATDGLVWKSVDTKLKQPC